MVCFYQKPLHLNEKDILIVILTFGMTLSKYNFNDPTEQVSV